MLFLAEKNVKALDFIGGNWPVNNSLIRVNMLSSLPGATSPKNLGRGGGLAPTNWAAKILCGKYVGVLIVSCLFAVGYIEHSI
jgi:hypothetical protein